MGEGRSLSFRAVDIEDQQEGISVDQPAYTYGSLPTGMEGIGENRK